MPTHWPLQRLAPGGQSSFLSSESSEGETKEHEAAHRLASAAALESLPMAGQHNSATGRAGCRAIVRNPHNLSRQRGGNPNVRDKR